MITHMLKCPHCGHIDAYDPNHSTEPVQCQMCEGTFINLGFPSVPNWGIQLSEQIMPKPLPAARVAQFTCPYCLCQVKSTAEACPRCKTDLTQCGMLALRQSLAEEQDERVCGAYAGITSKDKVTQFAALLRLHRANSYMVRQAGGSVELADLMHPIPEPPKNEALPVREDVDPSAWEGEAEGGSLAKRALASFALLIGFYFLAFGIIGGLIALVVASGWNIFLTIFLLPMAIGLLIAVFPRWDKFEEPGPELTEAEQPELFEVIREVSEATGVAMPANVYLVHNVNAWVTHRGGLMGLGSKRVMGLGLPLLQGLSNMELKAVLAHEFGHFHGGDVALGAWIFKTREAIARTVFQFASGGFFSRFFLGIFASYWEFFLRVTQKISRHQEYNADAMAAQTMGANALSTGLTRVGGLSSAFVTFWQEEAVPVIEAGYRPRLYDGFQRFARADHMKEYVSKRSNQDAYDTDAHPFSSHPPVGLRLAAARRFPDKPVPHDDPIAVSLLRGLDQLELELFNYIVEGARTYPALDWSRLADDVYLPMWRKMHQDSAHVTRGVALADLPAWSQDVSPLVERLDVYEEDYTVDEIRDTIYELINKATSLAFIKAGFALKTEPGEPVSLVYGRTRINALMIMQNLASGEMREETWAHYLDMSGLGDHLL